MTVIGQNDMHQYLEEKIKVNEWGKQTIVMGLSPFVVQQRKCRCRSTLYFNYEGKRTSSLEINE